MASVEALQCLSLRQRRCEIASLEEIKAQRDKLNGAIDAYEAAFTQAQADATAAASAGALATTAQQTADASATLSDQKKAEAAAEAQKLADLFAATPPSRRARK